MTEKCIACGTSPCYISFLGNVECSNEKCKYYSADLYPPPPAPLPVPASKAEDEKDGDEPKKKQLDMKYMWVNHHHDFGDDI